MKMSNTNSNLSLWISILLVLHLSIFSQGHPHEEDVEHAVDHESHLFYHLLDHYVRDIRPAANDTDPVRVAVKLSILNLDGPARTGIVKLTFFLRMSWHDPRLKWNLTEYDGLHTVSVSSHQIWTPELTPLESEILNSGHGPDEVAIISHKGDVSVLHTEKAHLSCTPVNVAHFPSDSLECAVTLMSTAYNGRELKLVLDAYQSTSEAFDLPIGLPNSGWNLDTESTEFLVQVRGSRMSGSGHPGIKISIAFHRDASFYWNVCVVPAAVLAFLIPLEFVFPPGSSVKAILGVMIALGEIIVLAELSSAWVSTVAVIPKAGLFCVSAIVLACLAAVVSVLMNSLVSGGSTHKEVPQWLKSLCFGRCGIRRLVCLDDYSPVGGSPRLESLHSRNGTNLIDSESLPATDQGARPTHETFQPEVIKDIHSLLSKLSVDDKKRRVNEEWEEVVRVLDRMFFVVFFLFILTTAFAFLS